MTKPKRRVWLTETEYMLETESTPKQVLHVRRMGEDSYVILDELKTNVFDKARNGFVFEPSPSNRTKKFLKNTRFPLQEAIELAHELLTEGDEDEDDDEEQV